jgi:hypothetical protein
MHNLKLFFILILLLFISFITVTSALKIRVLIYQDAKIELKSDTGFSINYRTSIKYTTDNKTITFTVSKNGIKME